MSIFTVPAGQVPDKTGADGLIGLMANANNYAMTKAAITSAVPTPVTAAQLMAGMIVLAAGAGGGFIIQLPSTASIIGVYGLSVMTDGTYQKVLAIKNDSVGQTGTVTIGDASTTLTGTMTVATATTRWFLLSILTPTTIAIENLGSMGL